MVTSRNSLESTLKDKKWEGFFFHLKLSCSSHSFYYLTTVLSSCCNLGSSSALLMLMVTWIKLKDDNCLQSMKKCCRVVAGGWQGGGGRLQQLAGKIEDDIFHGKNWGGEAYLSNELQQNGVTNLLEWQPSLGPCCTGEYWCYCRSSSFPYNATLTQTSKNYRSIYIYIHTHTVESRMARLIRGVLSLEKKC